VYTAHLDHHGICAPGQPDPICNGAIDDATGIAEMLEIARGFVALRDRARTVVFIATTGEERGLRGAQWFAHHPTIPPAQIVAIWFARVGVPSATLWQGFTDAAGSKSRGEAAFREFRKNRYHQPGDGWSATYDWEGAAQMARTQLLIGVSLLDGPPPQWKPGAPFKRRARN